MSFICGTLIVHVHEHRECKLGNRTVENYMTLKSEILGSLQSEKNVSYCQHYQQMKCNIAINKNIPTNFCALDTYLQQVL